jgi:hypothetical protein
MSQHRRLGNHNGARWFALFQQARSLTEAICRSSMAVMSLRYTLRRTVQHLIAGLIHPLHGKHRSANPRKQMISAFAILPNVNGNPSRHK